LATPHSGVGPLLVRLWRSAGAACLAVACPASLRPGSPSSPLQRQDRSVTSVAKPRSSQTPRHPRSLPPSRVVRYAQLQIRKTMAKGTSAVMDRLALAPMHVRPHTNSHISHGHSRLPPIRTIANQSLALMPCRNDMVFHTPSYTQRRRHATVSLCPWGGKGIRGIARTRHSPRMDSWTAPFPGFSPAWGCRSWVDGYTMALQCET